MRLKPIAQVQDKFGDVQVLINNAARDDRRELTSLSAQAWDQSINTNCAEAALFLASNAARMITGQSIVVDGGRALT